MGEYPPDIRNEIKVLEGDTFFISDDYGNIYHSGPFGLFHRDTRYLSRYWLEINGEFARVLTSKEINYFSAAFFLTNPPLGELAENTISIIRHRFVGDSVHEDLIIENHNCQPVTLVLSFNFDTDFADLFQVKRAESEQPRQIDIEVNPASQSVSYRYQRDNFLRQTTLIFAELPQQLSEHRASFQITLPANGRWQTCLEILMSIQAVSQIVKPNCSNFADSESEMFESLRKWRGGVPRLNCDCDLLNHIYRRSYIDLAALRLLAQEQNRQQRLLAAGLPWFMALFGRDTIITSYQTMLFGQELAIGALRALATQQGTQIDDFRDEQPGKILHERRFGELTIFRDTPHSPYYGSIDATPLFLILLSEVYRWTGDQKFINEMRASALAALEWIDRYGDLDQDGYLEYQTRSAKGLPNQGWKDSTDAVRFASGELAQPPIALCEVQGYVYDAKLRLAELAAAVWQDEPLAARLRREAAELKQRFNRDYWIEARGGYFAFALDRDKRQVDALTSNIGHLLWSGIVDAEKAALIVKQLLSPALYSGWGVRTMSDQDRGFNPISYHNGTVWPHDNSIIAHGLARAGYYAESNQIASNILRAGGNFDYRLPEVFAGYARERYTFPVRYPTSSSPQAWASGAPILLLRTMLGLEPDLVGQTLQCRPYLPELVHQISLKGVRAFGKQFDIVVENGQAVVSESDGKASPLSDDED